MSLLLKPGTLGISFIAKRGGEGELHFGFIAASRQEVKDFHAAALANGATDDGAPGPRSEYGEPYYGCFVRDLDGHKIEATFWDIELAKKLGMMD